MMRIVTGDEIRIETGKDSRETRVFINDEEIMTLYPFSIKYDDGKIPVLEMGHVVSPQIIREVRAFLVEGNDMITFEDWLRNRNR
ncbi:MAG: hypothetical protein WC822_04550 [Candidatus Paceibacterota bacterium]|jgi:hypothetical protein